MLLLPASRLWQVVMMQRKISRDSWADQRNFFANPFRSGVYFTRFPAMLATIGGLLAKPNYQFEKRQRDLAKKSKQEEKRRQKLAGKMGDAKDDAEASGSPDASASLPPGAELPAA